MRIDQDDILDIQRYSSHPPPYESQRTQEKGTDDASPVTASIDMMMLPHQDPNNPFAFTPEQLMTLMETRDMDFLDRIGGVEGVAKGLHSDTINGLYEEQERHELRPISLRDLERRPSTDSNNKRILDQEDEEEDIIAYHQPEQPRFFQRRAVFGSNVLPQIQITNIFQLMWESLQDKTLVCRIITNCMDLLDIKQQFSRSY